MRQGVTWRALTEGFPHRNTAFWYFQECQKGGTWVEDAPRKAVRLAEGRASATPSAGPADSQTLKGAGQRGFDGGKRATGVKRHAVADTPGPVWGLCITPASMADGKGARAAGRDARGDLPTHPRADSAYRVRSRAASVTTSFFSG